MSQTMLRPVPNSSGVEPPVLPVPAGAVDCHHHIFDPRFPKLGKPMRAVGTVDDYALLKRRLGITRSVVVAPNSYGIDNACLLDALDRFGDDSRGVAIVATDAPLAQMQELDRQRVRGGRFYLVKGTPATAEELTGFSRKAADLDWHMEIMPSRGDALVDAEPMLAQLACRIVIDHLGYTPQPQGIGHAAFATMLRLLDTGNAWIKLSGVYFTSASGFPDYADVDDLATRLVQHRPDRMLWGTDWPHSGEVTKPDDAKLLDQSARWAPDAQQRHAMLVSNPAKLYWGH
ncbi:amidohydrolase family protein [Devosia sp. XGJD_8]|uniref:amidohydrolase family protein n=1 Tax=Devosia sp. XGJD_8 TaxID=3391187 RepID=UPI003984BD4E